MDDIFLDEELICAVCRDIFVEPVTLPCGHNYCEECVNELKRFLGAVEEEHDQVVLSQHYSCPLCLAPCDVKIDLKKNVVLNNIIEKYQRKRASGVDCSVCKGQQKLAAEKVCLNCEESYCTLHIMPHLENNTLRQHVLVNPMANTSKLCKEHGKELELYCKTDSTALCVYCMLPSEAKHLNGHNVVKLSDALSKLKEDCEVKLDSIKGSLSEVNDGLSKLEEAASHSKESLESQQRECTGLLSRIKLFLEFEEKAWQKRFSVDVVQQTRNETHRAERLKRLKGRLVQAHEALLQALSIQDPLLLLQTLKNADWSDEETCVRQIQEVNDWSGAKPLASTRISPLFQTLCKTFAGDDILLNPTSAHHKLRLNPERSAVWVTEEACSGAGDSVSSGSLYCVLSDTAFIHGVHHWEVVVGTIPSWAVGVSYGGSQVKALRSGLGNDDSWVLRYNQSRRQFCAQHDWLQFCFAASGTGPPSRVGVFLDVDSGILSFYDAVRLEHLYTFYCSLHSPVYPAFCLNVENDERGPAQQMRVLNPVSDV